MSGSFVRTISVASVVVLICLAAPAMAELPAYMTVEGAQQGTIDGDVTRAGREGTFEIHELHHLSSASSQGAEHQPFIVTTRISKGTPSLLRALDNGELLTVTIRLYRPDDTGTEVNYYTVTLQNARLVIAEPIVLDVLDPDQAKFPARIRLRFEFDTIFHAYEIDSEQILL